MSVLTLSALAVSLYITIFLSIGIVILLTYKAIKNKSLLDFSRILYPIAVTATSCLELDRIQFALTGIDGSEDIWLITVGVLVLLVAILRATVVILDLTDKSGRFH
jgi:hypothetical protein